MNKNAQIQRIKQKTKELIELKTAYNQMVSDVDQEFSDKIEKLNEDKIHFQLKLARDCLSALKENKSLLPRVIRELKDAASIDSNGDYIASSDVSYHSGEFHSDPAYYDNDPLKSDEEISGDVDDEDLDVSLDVDAYLKQYDAQGALEIDSD